MKQYKVLIDSGNWYCQSNLILSSSLYKYLKENNHQITHDPNQADYIIINSCGVFDETEKRSIDLYKKYNHIKKNNSTIIMYGCLTKINSDILKNLNLITISFDENDKLDDIFYNSVKFKNISSYCNEKIMKILTNNTDLFDFRHPKHFKPPNFLLKISKKFRENYSWMMDQFSYENKMSVEIVERGTGCTGDCSYCVIKKAKKKIKSRSTDNILKDINDVSDYYKTLVLVADDCGGYGIDTNSNLPELIGEIEKKYPDLLVEIFYLNPIWIVKQKNQYLDIFRRGKITFSMITVESGSNKIIKNMNRTYDIKKVLKIIKKLRKISPNTFFATNFLAGYPGENTIDFLKTLLATRYFDLPLAYPYQDREGAKSKYLSNKKSKFTIYFRHRILLYISRINIIFKLLTIRKKQ